MVRTACELHLELRATDDGLFIGYFLETTAVAPTIWTESFPPTAAIEPVLPDPHKPNDPVQFREVFADESEVCTQPILQMCCNCQCHHDLRPHDLDEMCNKHDKLTLPAVALILVLSIPAPMYNVCKISACHYIIPVIVVSCRHKHAQCGTYPACAFLYLAFDIVLEPQRRLLAALVCTELTCICACRKVCDFSA